MSDMDPDAFFAGGEKPALLVESSGSMGLSAWVFGDYPREGGGKRGPSPKASRVPVTHRLGDRRKVGRPVREHAFLDLVRSRLSKYRRRKKPDYKKDLLQDFREELWFLILAGYPVNSIRWVFSSELPKLFGSLSFDGVVTSLRVTLEGAVRNRIDLDEEYLDLLEYYSAGPWAHNAPDWLRAQYGVELVNSGSGGKDSDKGPGTGSKGGGRAAVPAGAVVPGTGEVSVSGTDGLAGGKSLEDSQKEREFVEAWVRYCSSSGEPSRLSPEEVTLGVSQGLAAVLLFRQSKPAALEPVGSRELVPAPGVVVPRSDSVVSVPGGSEESGGVPVDRMIPFLDEAAKLEAFVGRPLNLTALELREGLEVGLLTVLSRRPGGLQGLGGPEPSMVTPVSGSSVSPVLVDEKPAVLEVPVEVVPPVLIPAPSAADVAPVEEVKPAPAAEVPAEVVPSAVPVRPKEYDRPVPSIVLPAGMVAFEKKEYPPEMLRYDGYVAPGYPTPLGDLTGLDVQRLSPLPEVWVLEDRDRVGPVVSKFVESLGAAAPYLVDSYGAEQYGEWVLEDSHGLGLRKYFFGRGSKRVARSDLHQCGEPYGLIFPELKSAPKDWEGFRNLTISQARACFEEWREPRDFYYSRPTDELIDMVERGMGPRYWSLGSRFLLQWMMSLAVGQAVGMGHRTTPSGLHRYIPFAAVITPDLAQELWKSGSEASVLWRPLHPLFLETLAPRNPAENLPGHRWVTGMGYMKEEIVEKCIAVSKQFHPESDPFFEGLDRYDGFQIMAHWAKDVATRVRNRAWLPVGAELSGVPVSGFFDVWRPSLCEPFLRRERVFRNPSSCFFVSDSGLNFRLFMAHRNWIEMGFFDSVDGLPPIWDQVPGSEDVVAELRKLQLEVHAFSLLAVTYYLRYLEQSFPRLLNKKVPGYGYKVPESLRFADSAIADPWGGVDEPAKYNLAVLDGKKVWGSGKVARATDAMGADGGAPSA